jgi:hypothetical protein
MVSTMGRVLSLLFRLTSSMRWNKLLPRASAEEINTKHWQRVAENTKSLASVTLTHLKLIISIMSTWQQPRSRPKPTFLKLKMIDMEVSCYSGQVGPEKVPLENDPINSSIRRYGRRLFIPRLH